MRCRGYLRRDPTVRRDLAWLPIHAVWGWAVGAVGVQIGVNVVRDLTFPLWWYLLPLTEASLLNGLVSVTDWGSVWWAILLGLVWSGHGPVPQSGVGDRGGGAGSTVVVAASGSGSVGTHCRTDRHACRRA